MTNTELWVDQKDTRNTKLVHLVPVNLAEGEIRVKIDKFALTSNNVGYALGGSSLGFWSFYPADTGWGKVPVWGLADVVESRCESIQLGERLYGFFPMASHVVMEPGNITETAFEDVTLHRNNLPSLYNRYNRCQSEPEFSQSLENERCLLFPLFATSFVISDYLADNDFFNAKQIIIGSVSSKTGLGLARLLKDYANYQGKVVGLTSPSNHAFVEGLQSCDQLISYGDEAALDVGNTTVFVDMSGNGPLTHKLHHLFTDNMLQSIQVGATHWEAVSGSRDLPGAKPQFFFAPSQVAKRDKDWGPGVFFQKAYSYGAQLASDMKSDITVEHVVGGEGVQAIWLALLDNQLAPNRGVMATVHE